jgi:hypothetical protein
LHVKDEFNKILTDSREKVKLFFDIEKKAYDKDILQSGGEYINE